MKIVSIIILFGLSIIANSQITTNYEVYFDKNSAKLTTSTIQSLKNISAELKKNKEEIVDSILLKGFCDRDGGSELNRSLSRERVMSVYDYMNGKLSVTSVFLFESFGNSQLKYDSLSDDNNRRVEIVVFVSIKAKPKPNPKPTLAIKTPKESEVKLAEVKQGDLINMKGIQFYGGTARPLSSAKPVMDELLGEMKKNPNMVIEIKGHICCTMDDSDNLSGQRALSVKRYLVEAGIDENRIQAKGYGRTQPLTDESSEEKKQMNRRVEVLVLKK